MTIQDIIRRHTNITPKVEKLGGMLVTTVPTAPQLQQQLRVSKGRKETGMQGCYLICGGVYDIVTNTM